MRRVRYLCRLCLCVKCEQRTKSALIDVMLTPKRRRAPFLLPIGFREAAQAKAPTLRYWHPPVPRSWLPQHALQPEHVGSSTADSQDGTSRCHLLALSHDELGVIVDGLADPLQPVVAAAASRAAAHMLRLQGVLR